MSDMRSRPVTPFAPVRISLPFEWGDVLFEPPVLEHFAKNRQKRYFSCEAGGQLFADLANPKLFRVVEATGPRRSDLRSIFGFRPDRKAEQLEISKRYELGLHFVGDWHTHPQRHPSPSSTDLNSMREMVQQSRY